MSTPDGSPSPRPDFRERLNRLYDERTDANGKPYTNARIVQLINSSGLATVTEAHMSNLRNGKGPEPRLNLVEAIAHAFGVPATYFLAGPASDSEVEAQLRALVADNPALADQVELLLTMAQVGVTRIGARGTQFTDRGRRAFTRLIQAAGRLSEPEVDAVLRVAEVMAADEGSDGSVHDV
jgi:transcriptional regulator with XRE-family HTH domain